MKQTFIIAKEQLRGLTFVEDSELEKTIKSMFRSQREYWSLSEPDRRKKISRQSVKQRRMRNTTELSSRKRSKVHGSFQNLLAISLLTLKMNTPLCL